MVKRTSLESADCPVARSLDAIGDWWSLLIIRDAQLGRRRFGEFQKSLGLAKNILTTRLRTLVERGILTTAPASDGRPAARPCRRRVQAPAGREAPPACERLNPERLNPERLNPMPSITTAWLTTAWLTTACDGGAA